MRVGVQTSLQTAVTEVCLFAPCYNALTTCMQTVTIEHVFRLGLPPRNLAVRATLMTKPQPENRQGDKS